MAAISFNLSSEILLVVLIADFLLISPSSSDIDNSDPLFPFHEACCYEDYLSK